jgi:Tfp pilus assembly protein PilZ
MENTLNGLIDILNLEMKDTALSIKYFLYFMTNASITIYIKRDYGASRNTKPLVLRVRVSNLKVQIADPNL